ncbi:MAG: serine hydrolase [Clostridia bacterium]|nr:serine hydrolase [Clostridia bacterium]
MKHVRRLLASFLMILLLVPVISLAEQTPEPMPEGTPEPTPMPTPLFGVTLGIDDAQRAKRDKAHRSILGASRAQGVYVADANDLSLCYFAKREHVTFPPGSTTKIMTALLTLENVPLDEIVTTPREATLLGGTNTMLGLAKDEQLSAEDMLYGLMLVSGNDCAISLAFHQAGSEEAFAERMNERAAELGMVDTNFTNPCGRNVGDNHTTPYDLALLTQAAMQNADFRKIVATAEYTIPANPLRKKPELIRNSNRLVSDAPGRGYHYPYAIGVKTGATALGTCLVNAAKKEDVTILCVQMGMLGDDNAERRAELFWRAIQFFEYVFTYEYTDVDAETMIGSYEQAVRVENLSPFGADGFVTAKAGFNGATAYRPVREIDLLLTGLTQFSVTANARAEAPVHRGDLLGTVTFSYNGRVWFELPLYADQDIELPPTPVPSTPIPVTEEELPTPTASPTPVPTASATPEPEAPQRSVSPEAIVLPIVGALLLGLIAALAIPLTRRRKGTDE